MDLRQAMERLTRYPGGPQGGWPRWDCRDLEAGRLLVAEIEHLRADLARKDAALKAARELDKHYWCGEGHGPLEVALHAALEKVKP